MNTILLGAPLWYPKAKEWMWNYCHYLGPFTDHNGDTYDLGVHIHPNEEQLSAAIVYGNEPGDYLSGDLNTFDGELYDEVRRRLKELNLNKLLTK